MFLLFAMFMASQMFCLTKFMCKCTVWGDTGMLKKNKKQNNSSWKKRKEKKTVITQTAAKKVLCYV